MNNFQINLLYFFFGAYAEIIKIHQNMYMYMHVQVTTIALFVRSIKINTYFLQHTY